MPKIDQTLWAAGLAGIPAPRPVPAPSWSSRLPEPSPYPKIESRGGMLTICDIQNGHERTYQFPLKTPAEYDRDIERCEQGHFANSMSDNFYHTSGRYRRDQDYLSALRLASAFAAGLSPKPPAYQKD